MKNHIYLYLILVTLITSACVITKTPVGSYNEETGKEYQYSKAKQIFLFWGIVPLGRASAATPTDGSCEVITKRTVGDALVTFLTVGIVSTYTVKVMDKRKEE